VRFPVSSRWLAVAALAGFGLVVLAVRGGPGQPLTSHPARGTLVQRTPKINTPVSDQSGGRPRGTLRLPWEILGTIVLAVVLMGIIVLLVAFWPRLPGWLRIPRRTRAARRPIEPAPDDLARQVARTLALTMSQLAAGGQIRDGVILCWHRLEQTAEAAGLRRSPADTSSELADRLLAMLPLSEAPLKRLAALYREARFSSHPLPATAVAQAQADLALLRAELEAGAAPPVGASSGAGHG
jgi:hypothetical protein